MQAGLSSHSPAPEAAAADLDLLRLTPVPFSKMSGSGNDFVVIDNRDGRIPAHLAPEFTRRVCRHRLSVGADGVVLISHPHGPAADFHWRYINADGTDGEMCGNGAMCGARFAWLNGISAADCTFETLAGLVSARVAPDRANPAVRIRVEDPGPVESARSVTVDGQLYELVPILVGVPHAVLVTGDADAFADEAAFARIGRAIRIDPTFAPAGVNVNVIDIRDRHTIRMRTYERGVEAETLACGTGSIASSVIATALGLVELPVSVITSSGRTLSVEFSLDGDRARDVFLGGEARLVATGEIGPDALR